VSEVTQIKKEHWIASPQVLLAMNVQSHSAGQNMPTGLLFLPLALLAIG
jgi:hypothetical protein